MKIKSPFQDYYDYSCTYFDDSTFYGRIPLAVQNEIFLNEIKKMLPSYSNRDGNVKKFYPGFVVLAGVMYPFVKVKTLTKNSDTFNSISYIDSDIFYDYDTSIPKYMKSFFDLKNKEFDVSAPVAVYDPTNVVLPKGVIPQNFEGNFYDYSYSFHKEFILNAPLKSYKFPMDGRIVLQTIETYLNRHKEIQTTKITDDKVLRDSKGFDDKSFKKRKQ